MFTAGLDIGSRTIALVEWDGERIVREEVVKTGTDPLANSRRLIGDKAYDRLIATGYGRHLASEFTLADGVVTEIKAYAMGAHRQFGDVRTVIDIGGQDSKVIRVKPDGGVAEFEMNDRCAAGTGRFLENMALALDLSVDQLGQHALDANGESVQLSSICAVFAESEVVSLIGRGENSRKVALGIHQAIASRVSAMARRVGAQERVVFAGGVAYNPCMQQLLSQELGVSLIIPTNPQTLGALGAALYAASPLMR
jgi:predicted CoA-substrate-specific enzyme activase